MFIDAHQENDTLPQPLLYTETLKNGNENDGAQLILVKVFFCAELKKNESAID